MNLIPLMVGIPLGAGFVLALMPRRRTGLSDLLANGATLALLILSVGLIGKEAVYTVGGWRAPLGIVLVLDGLSGLMLLTISVVSFAATLFSTRYMERYTARGRYYALFMLMVAGMNGAVLTGDIFNFFVFMEIAAISSYALVAFGCEDQELEAAFKYAILGSVASTFVLLAIALLYCRFGSLNMAHLGSKLKALASSDPARMLAIFSLMLFIAGLGMKAALVPFHAWLPDAHPSAPAPISAMLSGVLIKAIGVYALLRIVFCIYGVGPQIPHSGDVAYGLMVLGALSMMVGVILAIAQWDFKRLLAYHSISQIGYVVLAVGVGGAVLARGGSQTVAALAIVGGLFHLVNHAVFKSLLFLTAGAVEYRTGTRQLQEMGGLRHRMPLTGACSLVASFSIAGVPPFNGFVSKLAIILSCVLAGYYGFAAWAVIASILTLASFMKLQRYAFFGNLVPRWRSIREVPAAMGAAMILLTVLCLATSALILPGLRAALLDPAQRDLTAKDQYLDKVLRPALVSASLSRPAAGDASDGGPETELAQRASSCDE